jgi:hypothetical protein
MALGVSAAATRGVVLVELHWTPRSTEHGDDRQADRIRSRNL